MTSIFKLTLAEFKALKPRPEMLAFAKACNGDMRRFWNTCPNGEWLLWLLQKTQNLDELKARKVALDYAKKVLPVFEEFNPFDKNLRRCVRAIESFIKNPTVANQRLMMDAAYEIYANLTAAPCFRHPSGSNKGKHTLYQGDEKDKYDCQYCGNSNSSLANLTAAPCFRHPLDANKGKHEPAL